MGMAKLSARVRLYGFLVFRFDLRGVGDGVGEYCGFLSSGPDIAEAVAAFLRASPGLRRMVALGNCDAATALALFHDVEEMAALLLANPWVVESDSALPPPAAIRRRYWTRMRNPRKLWELLTGRINVTKIWQGMKAAQVGGLEIALAKAMETGKTVCR